MNKENMTIATPEAARAEIEYLVSVGRDIQSNSERVEIIDVDGDKYAVYRGSMKHIEKPKPVRDEKPDVFEAFSLGGLVEFIKTDVDGLFSDDSVRHIVRVVNPKQVEVISPMRGFYRERDLVAKCNALVPNIPFDHFLNVEDFQIMLQSRFMESANRALVLQLSGSLRSEQTNRIADDGVSQKVTINRGVSTADDVIVKNPVNLKPLRTFYEVDQPESPFILRFDEDANAALFEGDGGAWKLRAVENIRAWLTMMLEGCNVVVIA